MNHPAGILANVLVEVERVLAGTVSEVVGDGTSRRLGDEDVLATMAAASRVVRLGEALLIEMAAQVEMRSAGLRDERMTTQVRMPVDERARATHHAAVVPDGRGCGARGEGGSAIRRTKFGYVVAGPLSRPA